MGEITKLTALVLDAKDYKEKDKLLTLFSAEMGVVNVLIKGVKGSNAKLKSAKEPFCFGEFLVTQRGGFFVVTTVNIIDTFFEITKDYTKYIYGCNILVSDKHVCKIGEINTNLFVLSLKAIKALCYESVKPEYVMIKFLIDLFTLCGYGLDFKRCNSCNGTSIKKYFDFFQGSFVCNNCKSSQSEEVESVVFNALRILSDIDYEKLSNIKLSKGSEKKALKLLLDNFENRFEKALVYLD